MNLNEKLWRSVQAAPGTTIGEGVWYALLAGGVWLAFYVVFRGFFYRRRLWSKPPTGAQIRRELLHSVRSLAVFGVMGSLVVFGICSGKSQMYFRIDRFGWWWFAASLPAMILMHDTYFYWTHRLMHHRRLYRMFHHTHHLSTSPTPWAAYAFSPLEAFVQAGISPLVIFTIPVHPTAFSIFMLWQIGFNVMGHCGHEIWPHWFLRSPMGWLLNTPTHHALHHERCGANFGLYFNLWDRLLGTNHAIYAERFARATEQATTQQVVS